MATRSARLTDLTMADIQRCHDIQVAVDEADTAVQSANFPGKAAVRLLLRQCYENAGAIIRKGALPALRKAELGKWAKSNYSQALWEKLISMAPRPINAGEPGDKGGSEGGSD